MLPQTRFHIWTIAQHLQDGAFSPALHTAGTRGRALPLPTPLGRPEAPAHWRDVLPGLSGAGLRFHRCDFLPRLVGILRPGLYNTGRSRCVERTISCRAPIDQQGQVEPGRKFARLIFELEADPILLAHQFLSRSISSMLAASLRYRLTHRSPGTTAFSSGALAARSSPRA